MMYLNLLFFCRFCQYCHWQCYRREHPSYRYTTVDAPPVDLGAAGNYVILAKCGISTVSASNISGDDIITKAVSASDSSIYGDVAVSPFAATATTGFAMVLDSSGQWSTSSQINSKPMRTTTPLPLARI
jgi:hypothetical protein